MGVFEVWFVNKHVNWLISFVHHIYSTVLLWLCAIASTIWSHTHFDSLSFQNFKSYTFIVKQTDIYMCINTNNEMIDKEWMGFSKSILRINYAEYSYMHDIIVLVETIWCDQIMMVYFSKF